MGLKRAITLLESGKGLKYLYHTSDVRLVGVHYLKGFQEIAHQLDSRERLNDALLGVVKSLTTTKRHKTGREVVEGHR